ncbi:MAG: hypothetical protein K2P81_00075 [Bacteriovoracaceae bacterium]|nr:hypothetical protein [Bacteriovoracaceae bacterium]
MKRFIVTLLTLSFCVVALAQQNSVVKDIITDPNLSLRCKELMQDRTDKIKVRQKLSSLLQRNQKVLKETPEMRKIMRKRLEANQITVRNELYLATLQVQSMEESIIRSGCPGINL